MNRKTENTMAETFTIPRNNSPLNKSKRRKAILRFFAEWMAKHPKAKVWNCSIREYICVDKRVSPDETSHWAQHRYMSTVLVLYHFDEILRYAKKTGEADPKSKTSSGRFSKLILLERTVKGVGKAKLTVGVRKDDGKKTEYCITAIE